MNRKIILCLMVFLPLVLAVRVFFFISSAHTFRDGETVSLDETLFSEPKTLSYGQELSLRLDSGQSLVIYAPSYPKLYYGDQIQVSGVVKEKKIGENYILAMNQPQISVKTEPQNPILALATVLRYKITSFYDAYLPPTPASLLLGIVFGIKENMPQSFSDLLRNTGVTHVIAASGMNITLTAGFFAFLFGTFLKRKLALVITVICICFYTLLSGLEPSILRAAIMGIIAFSAQIAGRQSNSILALFITAFIMLFISPILIYDVGFQLSFFSTLGILTTNPFFERHLSKISFMKIVGGDLATTLSAQLFTLPILIGTFGTYSLISIIVNMLVLWTVPIDMVFGALAAFLGLVFVPLGVLMLYVSYPFLIYFEWVVKTLGSLNLVLNISSIPWQITLGYYLLILALILKPKKHEKNIANI